MLEPPVVSYEVQSSLPTFMIIGAPKAGTTSLHAYLSEHPAIAMSTVKEPALFAAANWRERILEYPHFFEKSAPARGEASVEYSCYPWAPEVPDRVRSTIPDVRLIYLVRDPIARLRSQYAQDIWDSHRIPFRPFEKLMEDLEDPGNIPVWASRYGTQLERWLEHFDEHQILIVDSDQLLEVGSRSKTIGRVLEFLGVDPEFTSPSWTDTHNTAAHHRLPRRSVSALGRLGRPFLRLPVARRLATTAIPKPQLTPEQEQRLRSFFTPEVRRLRELTGVRLLGWEV